MFHIFGNGKGCVGKDTQLDMLSEKLRTEGKSPAKFSTGDFLRLGLLNGIRYGTDGQPITSGLSWHHLAEPYRKAMETGGVIPDEVMLRIAGQELMEAEAEGVDTVLWTGFPRSIPQLQNVDRWMTELGHQAVHVYFEAEDDIARTRAGIRRQEAINKGLKYRPDDEPGRVETRIEAFHNVTFPMLQMLRNEGRLLTVDAHGSIGEIQNRLVEGLLPRIRGVESPHQGYGLGLTTATRK